MSQHRLHGSCHCGRLSLTFSTRIAPESFSPRESEGRTFASVNARCITDASLGAPRVASPQQLDAPQKRERWTRLMIPDVELRVAA